MKIKTKKNKDLDQQLQNLVVRKTALKKIISVINKNNKKIKKLSS